MANKRKKRERAAMTSDGDVVISNCNGTQKHVTVEGPVHSLQIGPNGVFVNGERINGPDNEGGTR